MCNAILGRETTDILELDQVSWYLHGVPGRLLALA